MNRSIMLAATGLLAMTAGAYASDQPGTTADQWKEELSAPAPQGATDAGFLISTANITRGAGPLNRITGTLTPAAFISLDADVFCIRITDPASFSATVGGTRDSVLTLFNSAGQGIAFNDDRTDSTTSRAARLTNQFTSSLPVGDYFLAISLNNVLSGNVSFTRPLDGFGNLMFTGQTQLTPTDDMLRRVEYGPINPAATLTSWESYNTNALPFTFNYTITLTGAEYSLLPTPGAGAMLGMAGMMVLRRRRR